MAVYSAKCSGGGSATLYVSITENSYSAAANTSNVTVTMYAKADNTSTGAYSLNKNNPVSLTVDGVQRVSHYQTMDFRNMATVSMASWTGTISHGTDGKKTLSVEGSFSIIGPASVTGGSISCSQALTSLDRTAPTITLSGIKTGVNSITFTATSNVACKDWTITYYPSGGAAKALKFSASSATSVSYTLSGLSTNTTYTISVLATKVSNSVSGSSASSSAKTLGYSYISSIVSSVTLGNACTIKWTPYSSSFRFKLTFKCGSGTVTTDYISPATTSLYSHAYTFALATWAPYISGSSATCTVTLTTYSGTTAIGTSDPMSITLTVPNNSTTAPGAAWNSVADAGSVPTAFKGLYVQNFSKLTLKVKATPYTGATIKSITVTLDGKTYTASISSNIGTVTTDTIVFSALADKSGTLTASATVTDSRNFSTTIYYNVLVFRYYTPTVGIDLSISGTTVACTVSGSRASVYGKNTGTLTVKYVNVSDTSETKTYTYTIATSTSSDAWSQALTLTLPNVATETYEFTATFKDAYQSVTITKQTGVITISRYAGGKGVRLFGEAEAEGFWVGNIDYTLSDTEYSELINLL